jgi:hypothetical protein
LRYKIPPEYAIRPEDLPQSQVKIPLFQNSLAAFALMMVVIWVGFLWFSIQDPLTWMQMTSQTWVPLDRPEMIQLLKQHHEILNHLIWPLLGVYLLSLIWLQRGIQSLSLLHIVVLALPILFLAGLTLPFDSTDYTVYINYGWLQSHYDLNPYVYRVLDVSGQASDPMFRPHWTHMVTLYGPVFLLLMKGLTTLSQGNYFVAVGLLKLFNVLCHGVMGLLLFCVAKRLQLSRPDWVLWAYWTNPLMLIHQVAGLHNDIVATFFVVLALFCLTVSLELWALPLLMMGGLVKLFPAFLLPFFWRWMMLMRVQERRIRLGVLLSLAVFLASVFCYTTEYQKIPWEQILNLYTASYASLYTWGLQQLNQWSFIQNAEQAYPVLLWAGRVFCGVVLIVQLWRLRQLVMMQNRGQALQYLAKQSLILLFLVMLLASSRSSAWYFALLIPLVLILDERSFLRWFSLGFTTLLSVSILEYGNTTAPQILMALGFGVLWMGVGVMLERSLQDRLKRFTKKAIKKVIEQPWIQRFLLKPLKGRKSSQNQLASGN